MQSAASVGPVAAYRRFWLPELVVLGLLAMAAAWVFASGRVDLAAARWFYHPGRADPWAVAGQPVWNVCYRSAPWLTGALAVLGAAWLITGLRQPGARRLRLHGIFLLLCVAVGPGVIINGILKDHWGRPRPRQLVEFGGDLRYSGPLVPSGAHGKSFPCGHCSVGYLFAAGWWLWRRTRPRRAVASLVLGVVLGTLLGFGRMAAGAHFLSDAVWAGLIADGVAHVLYYYVLRIPAREDAQAAIYPWIERSPRARRMAIGAAVAFTGAILVGGLLSSPQDQDLTVRLALDRYPVPPRVLEVRADTLDVELRLVDGAAPAQIICTGAMHGFGLPTDDIVVRWSYAARPDPTLCLRVALKGWFTDMDGVAELEIPTDAIRRVVVQVHRGNIRVIDARTARTARPPLLDLHTDHGWVRRR